MDAAERIADAVTVASSAAATRASSTPEERAAVVEIAYLAVACDHAVDADELAAFRRIAARLDAGAPADEVVARIGRSVERAAADARLLELAAALASPAARALAFKAAYALARADQTASDQEFELELQLIDALGLAQADADRLAAEVDDALGARARSAPTGSGEGPP